MNFKVLGICSIKLSSFSIQTLPQSLIMDKMVKIVIWIFKFCEIVIVLSCCISLVDAQCSRDTNGLYRFGSECGFICHCLEKEQCNVSTGECPSGCGFEWVGPGCQHSNIALKQRRRHSDNLPSPYVKSAALAVDRDLSTCSSTNYENTTDRTVNPFLRVWTRYNFTLRSMEILTDDSKRKYFNGFKVMVEYLPEDKERDNDYIPAPSHTCYTHSNTSLEAVSLTVACDTAYTGNQVRIQLSRKNTQLVLCDVRIYGECAENVCTYDCNKLCYCNDITASDRVSGICTNGCKGRWSGKDGACDKECAIDKWGATCDTQCGNCRNNAPCDAVTGKCPTGCKDGYKDTEQCDTECDDWRFGQNCNSSCKGHCRNNSPCNKTDGNCADGCDPGYTGDDCTGRCTEGYHGIDCKERCSTFCFGGLSSCSHVDGACIDGCLSGYQGRLCDQKCLTGKWGVKCSSTCGKCLTGTCNHTDGICIDGNKCKAGYIFHPKCIQECENGTFGMNCTEQCSHNCNHVCDKVSGTCISCKAGWKGEHCETACSETEWGMDCSKKCGKCKDDDRCNIVNGTCSGGCILGYKNTSLCSDACEDGTYGVNCSLKCGNCRTDSICNKTTGVCHEGCVDGYTGDMCKDKEEILQSPEKTSPVAGIAGGIVGAVVVAVVVVGVVIVLKRRQTQNTSSGTNNGKISSNMIDADVGRRKKSSDRNNIYVNSTDLQTMNETLRESQGTADDKPPEEEKESDYYNTQSEHEVLLSELESYVKAGLANKEYFIKQFQQIPYGMKYPSTVATKHRNHGKNKYRSMYPYDHSRVTLKALPDLPDSDYINASHIMGYSGENSYIAAQGPIESTLQDFWRMIWENNVKTVVMATNLSEEGKMKCKQYWPQAGESIQHGTVIVVAESEDVFAEFIVRRLKVSQENKPDRKRIVTQFHYTAWPDKDVPKSTSSLLQFWFQVRKHDEKKTRPWLVHCSAGIGRTGTFIALDILFDQGRDKGSVDVYECVDELRKQRVNMVQTKDQYKYLHSIIVEALVLPSQPVHTDKFHSVYNDLKEIDPKTRKTQLLLQYETLQGESGTVNGKETEDDLYASAKRTENRNKNRYDNILAPNGFRPFLLTQVPGRTDYINGVFIPGYMDKYAYILTQTPLKSTVIDCCRLVYEYEVKVIVTFQENGDEDIGTYLPEMGSVKLGPFSMTFVSEDTKPNYITRDYQLKFQSENRSVTQLIFKQWSPTSLTPSDPDKMKYFLEELENFQRQNERKPILAQCLNGAERSGLVVVLMNILERLRFDKEVSIPLVIRQLKIRRQQIVPNFEQFKFCHDVVLSHIESSSTYANM